MWKKQSLQLLTALSFTLLCGKEDTQSSKTSHIFSKSGYTFLEVSHGLTLQELLILVSSFQKLFFKLTKESEEE